MHRRNHPCVALIGIVVILSSLLGTNSLWSPPIAQAAGAISGTAFRDFNANGIIDGAGEVGVAGVTVTAYGSGNIPRGSVITAADGTYVLAATGTGPYRIEFSGWPTTFQPGAQGSSNSTTVQFTDAPASNINLGLNVPEDYSQSNPKIATSIVSNGIQTAVFDDLITLNYDGTGVTNILSSDQLGSIWGLGYKRDAGILYAAAYLKRHVGFAPTSGTIDSIYAINAASGAQLGQFTLSALGVAVGADPRITVLPSNPATPNHDPEVFPWIGKRGIGDIDASSDGQRLYVVNLNSAAPSLAILNITTPLAPTLIQNVAINNPGCSNNEYAPFGVNEHRGQLYVGVVCTAETSGLRSDLRAYVLHLNGSSLSIVPGFPISLDQDRGCTYGKATPVPPFYICAPAEWNPWTNSFTPFAISGFGHTQPMLSDIAFDDAGNMLLGLRDRGGDQGGALNYATDTNDTTLYSAFAAGDTLRMCLIGTGYVVEGSAGCPTTHTDEIDQENMVPPTENNGIPTEFFDDNVDYSGNFPTDRDGHSEGSTGALAVLPGSQQVVVTHYDPTNTVFTGGLRWMSTTDGSNQRGAVLYPNQRPSRFGKANGLGDLEFLFDAAPVEIGNRVWLDPNRNGIQDAGELSIAGVTVHLYAPDGVTVLATAITDANGNYYFSNGTGTSTTSAIYGITGMTFNTAGFQIRLDNPADYATGGPLAGLTLTQPNVQTGDSDMSGDIADSDGTLANPIAPIGTGNYPTKLFNVGAAGFNNHTYDFGFFLPVPGIAITKLVNGADANDPNGVDVPMLAPGQIATWTYRIANTGTSIIPRADISVSDNVVGNLMVNGVLQTLAAPYTGAVFGSVNQLVPDDVLAPGETFQLLVTWIVPDFGAQDPNASTTDQWVPGCGNGSATSANQAVAYVNIGTVTIPGITVSDAAHLCNPLVEPNAITLARFSATWQGSAVVVAWATSAEVDTFGFQLLRSSDGTRANATRVTPTLIPAQGRGQNGAAYTWTDTTVTGGQSYTYWLEETEVDGTIHVYGPTTATAPGTSATYQVLLPLVRQ